jgi:hypothetical protein
VEPDTDEIREVIIQMQRSGLVRRFEEAGYNILTSGEIRPSNVVPVIATGQSGAKKVFPDEVGISDSRQVSSCECEIRDGCTETDLSGSMETLPMHDSGFLVL